MSTRLSHQLLNTSMPDPLLATVGGYCSEWNTTTFENVVYENTAKYVNLAVMNPGAMSVGNVLLLKTPGRPIILGRLFVTSAEVIGTP